MTTNFVATLLAAGAAAAAVALAPSASAETPAIGCDKGTRCSAPAPKPVRKSPSQSALERQFSKDVPAGWRNEAQFAQPGPGKTNPFGAGPVPPLLALE